MKKFFTKQNIAIFITVLFTVVIGHFMEATMPPNPPENDVSIIINNNTPQGINAGAESLTALLTVRNNMYVNDSVSVWNDAILEVAGYPVSPTNTTQGFFLGGLNNTGATQEVCANSTGKLVLCEFVEDQEPSNSCMDTYATCFISDTKILLANGKEILIQDVKIGDILKGEKTNNTVLGFHRPTLGEKKLYSFNKGRYFVTAEHPFMTTSGLEAIDPKLAMQEHKLNIEVGQLEIGDILVTENGNIELKTLDSKSNKTDTQLYNFKLDGDHTYYADGYLVHNKEVCSEDGDCSAGTFCLIDGVGVNTCSLHCNTVGEISSTSAGCPIGYDYRYCNDDFQWHCTNDPTLSC